MAWKSINETPQLSRRKFIGERGRANAAETNRNSGASHGAFTAITSFLLWFGALFSWAKWTVACRRGRRRKLTWRTDRTTLLGETRFFFSVFVSFPYRKTSTNKGLPRRSRDWSINFASTAHLSFNLTRILGKQSIMSSPTERNEQWSRGRAAYACIAIKLSIRLFSSFSDSPLSRKHRHRMSANRSKRRSLWARTYVRPTAPPLRLSNECTNGAK